MAEVEVKFERENRDGTVAVGTYLFDAARRLGVEVEAECGRVGACDSCAMEIQSGAECLTEPTTAELNELSRERRENGWRLACQAKLEKAGEITIMTKKKKEKEKQKDEEKTKEYRKEFEEMPLEKKIASLVELEAIALGETVSFVLNSPFKIFDIAMGVMAEFGLKLESDAKKQKRPAEHHAEKDGEAKTENKKSKHGKNKSGEAESDENQ